MLFKGAFQNKKVFCAMAVAVLATTARGQITEDVVDVVEDEDEDEGTVGDLLGDVEEDTEAEAEAEAPEPIESSVNSECVTRILQEGELLEPSEFLGPEEDCSSRQYRFGLEIDGELVFRSEFEYLWQSGVVCDRLRQQGDGNTVCYDRFDNAVWATDCSGDGVNVIVDADVVRAYDDNGNLVWEIDQFGGLSECYPGRTPSPNPAPTPTPPDGDRCEDVSSRRYGDMCVLQMIDFENMYVVNIEATEEGEDLISVDFNFDNTSPYNNYENYRIAVDTSNKQAFIIGQRAVGSQEIGEQNLTPDYIGCSNILRDDRYDMDDNDYEDLEFRRPTDYDHPCNEFAQNLIYFLVVENYFPRDG